jgi:Cdc6-like AAA superfamily ATPase
MTRPSTKDLYKACLINKQIANTIVQIEQDLEDSEEFVADIVAGLHRSALVYGSPGMGKTHLITKALENAGKKIGVDYLIARSHTTPMQFYAMLYLMREPGKFIVMDDCDGIMTGEEGVNLLKAATDPTFRNVGWASTAVVKIPGTDEIVPASFIFNGSIVIATNIRASIRGKAAQHQEAIKSRCVSWKMNYLSKDEQFAYIYHLVVDKNYLDSNPETAITWDQKIEMLRFIMSNLSTCARLDLRKPQHIARVMLKKPNAWQNHAKRFLESE